MTLFLIQRIEGPSWDEAKGFVVRAETEEAARKAVSVRCGDEGQEQWLDSQQSRCEIIHREGEEEVILRDFNAG